jgi:hypothetical protein
VLDPAQPIDDVEADLDFAVTGWGYTFAAFERQARVLIVAPYAWGDISGDVGGIRQTEQLSGLSDPRIKLSIGLRGAPALSAREFAVRPNDTIVAASLTVTPPVGQYESDSLVNLGYNRWGFKPEIGASRTIGPWTVEGAVGVWLYTRNSSYFPGDASRDQDPIVTLQTHVGYTFKKARWLALDGTWFSGGQTETNGIANPDRQDNSRLGVTFSTPIAAGHSLKLTYSTGATTRRGSDFDTFNLLWQYVRAPDR